ncbi:LamG domain-containing protein [Mesorhizobium dulcispinae]|uniref:LamG domain-containing protein n=1 Tax=Mesorhizobium dulcispinae TaxID=3072316 RepID=UPI002A244F04|nr:LamG-like jellyroll fold domain-containing protein [Mesorhizobium sp. VK23D]MDX8521303.1 LamG-like jellyroll fold domain-containing protein [Mesorhizobium sp. VK23D]
MARSFAGGTDQLYWSMPTTSPAVGSFAFRMKTTQTTVNAAAVVYWDTSSRWGFGFILNNTAGKLMVQGYSSSATPAIQLLSTTTINDGNWHSVVFNYNRNNGGANALFVDGAQEASGNSSALWNKVGNNLPIVLGDSLDTFWPSYVGEIAEIGHWADASNSQLDAAEIAALAKAFSPMLIRPASLFFYAPIVRETRELKAGLTATVTGGAVSDHPRKLGPGC